MKNVFVATMTLLILSGLGCAKASSSYQQPQATSTVLSTYCVTYPQNCNGSYYNNANGFQPYTYNGGYFSNNGLYTVGGAPAYFNSAGQGLCNCPVGTLPTYNSFAGMGCVNSNLLNNGYGPSGYAYFSYGYGSGANNNQWTNIPQVSNYVGYNNQSCYNGIVQSCLTDQQSMCPTGFACLASSAGSRLGLCVSNSTSSSGQIFR